jgi:tripeptide aminopeptidase
MRTSLRFSTAVLALSLAFGGSALAGQTNYATNAQRILASPTFKAAVATLDKDYDRYVAEGIKLTEIPAPPFGEQNRAKAYEAMLKEAGLTNVHIDAEGNAIGLRKGTKSDGKFVVVAAHLDTVFPLETDVKVKREGTRLNAPGIGDATFSTAALLAFARAMNAAGVKHRDDILFIGNVGEEGPGDLRGVRYLFTKSEYKDKIKAFMSVEGGSASGITTGGVGSRRYRITFSGPGGHSYGAFGLVNPMYALGAAAAEMSQVEVPEKPKTTFNIGVIGGGTSVNSIPLSVWMDIDMRSEAPEELNKVEEKVMAIVQEATKRENFARSTKEGQITVDIKKIGDRPAGTIAQSAEIVQIATAAVEAGGYKPSYGFGSTDSNIPFSMGIPAVTIGKNGPNSGGRGHSLDEWIDVAKEPMLKGMTTCLSLILGVAGME